MHWPLADLGHALNKKTRPAHRAGLVSFLLNPPIVRRYISYNTKFS